MIRRLDKLIIAFCIFAILLTGCWDYQDINERCITVSIGVDYVQDKFEFSGEVARIIGETGGTSDKAQVVGVYDVLGVGKTFEEARIDFNSRNPYNIFLGATRVVVFGENYAKKGIEPYLHRIDSLYDYRKTLLTVVSRDSPRELLKRKVQKDISVGFLIEDILAQLEANGRALYPNVGELLSNISFGNPCYLLPYIGLEKGDIKYLGLVVMKNSKQISVIDVNDTDGILYLLAKRPILVEAVPSTKDRNNMVSFRTMLKERKIKTDYINERVVINVNLDLTAELRYQYYPTPLTEEDIKKLEVSISQKVKGSIDSIVDRAQKELKCDIFDFAKHFKSQHLKIFEKIDWEEKFPSAKININVNTKILNTALKDTASKK